MLKKILGLVAVSGVLYAGCVSNKPAPMPVAMGSKGYLQKIHYPLGGYYKTIRGPASSGGEPERLVYYTKDLKTKAENVQVFTPDTWRSLSPGNRYDMLIRMYMANTRSISNSKHAHEACFTGQAEDVLKQFFTQEMDVKNKLDTIFDFQGMPSTDGFMFGLQFISENQQKHFRISSCRSGGKSSLISQKLLDNALGTAQTAQLESIAKPDTGGPPQSDAPGGQKGGGDALQAATGPSDGFTIGDQVQQAVSGLPHFMLRSDYDKATEPDVYPWLDASMKPKFDLSDPKQAEQFALLLQQYAYEGMVDQNPAIPNKNFIASENKKRFWCHMPWLNQGPNGREAIHGLTQELSLRANKMWPKPPVGGDWGVGYFNGAGCRAIEKVFGSYQPEVRDDKGNVIVQSYDKRIADPKIANLQVDDGTVIFKILFTTANFPEIQNAFVWQANAADPDHKTRQLRPMRHIQMDIAVKDRKLKGLAMAPDGSLAADGWIMLTYYYDENYKSPLKMNLPEGFKHMRPMGIQSGFSPQQPDSIIFKGAMTNQNSGKMLNGPADNPASSCLGCHAAAGTSVSMYPTKTDPGMNSVERWKEIKLKEKDSVLDFGQQFALAKRNYETRPR